MRRPVATGMHQSFKRGEFKTFKAVETFHLGEIENFKIWKGDEVDFDGHTLKIGNDTYTIPSARGAVKSGWLIPLDAEQTAYVPRPAGVVMSPADTSKSRQSHVVGQSAMADDERVMGDVQSVRNTAAGRSPKLASHVAQTDVMMLDQGVEVGKINVPATFRTQARTGQSVGVSQQITGRMTEQDKRASFYDLSEEEKNLLTGADGTAGMSAEEKAEWEEERERRRLAVVQAEALRAARRAEFEATGKIAVSEYDEETAMQVGSDLSRERVDHVNPENTFVGAVPFDESSHVEMGRAMQAMDNPLNVNSSAAPPAPQVVGTVGSPAQPTENLDWNQLSQQQPPEPTIPEKWVQTALGIDWNLGRPPHERMKDAITRFGWSLEILRSILEVEEGQVARFLEHKLAFEDKKASSAQPSSVTVNIHGSSEAIAKTVKAAIATVEPDKEEETAGTDGEFEWDTANPSHWAQRAKLAIQKYGEDKEALLAISELEINASNNAVAKRIQEYVEKTFP